MLAQRWQERYGGGSAEPRPELPPGGFLPPAGAGPASFEAPVYVPPAPGGGFRSPRMSAIMLALAGVLALAALAVDLVWLDKIGAEGASYDTVMDLARVMDALSVLQLVSVLAAAAAFIVWLYRAYGNLPILGIVKPRHARGWAIGAWFVPLANLVIPKQIANDVWRAGDPDLAPGEPGWRKRRVAALVHWWWAAYLVAGALIRIGASMLDNAAGFAEARDAVTVDAIGQGLTIVAALAAIWGIRRSTERQEARASALRAAGVLPAWA
jgi:adhesin HecA-like repeat protein